MKKIQLVCGACSPRVRFVPLAGRHRKARTLTGRRQCNSCYLDQIPTSKSCTTVHHPKAKVSSSCKCESSAAEADKLGVPGLWESRSLASSGRVVPALFLIGFSVGTVATWPLGRIPLIYERAECERLQHALGCADGFSSCCWCRRQDRMSENTVRYHFMTRPCNLQMTPQPDLSLCSWLLGLVPWTLLVPYSVQWPAICRLLSYICPLSWTQTHNGSVKVLAGCQ